MRISDWSSDVCSSDLRVPGIGALVANCDIPLDQARGLSEWTHDGRTVPLNVSAGLGHSIYAPVRFACRPEVTLLTLLPRCRPRALLPSRPSERILPLHWSRRFDAPSRPPPSPRTEDRREG